MSGMRILTKAEVVAGVPSRWARQYSGKNWDDKEEITAALKALKPGFTAEQADAIIGNGSWTRLECGICEQDASELIVFEHYDSSVSVCANCFGHAAALLAAPSHGREATE